jgi:hypothetical protein
MSAMGKRNIAEWGLWAGYLAALACIGAVLLPLAAQSVEAGLLKPLRIDVLGVVFLVLLGPGTIPFLFSVVLLSLRKPISKLFQAVTIAGATWAVFASKILERL